MKLYDCSACAAYCCGYPIIVATRADVARLARHFGISPEEAREKFTKPEGERQRKLRQKWDGKLGAMVCQFLNLKTRNCGVYRARPQICRDHPGDRCEWNDRRLLETIANGGKPVIRLKVAPWKIDADYPDYTAAKLPRLVEAYARGKRGKMEPPAPRKKKRR